MASGEVGKSLHGEAIPYQLQVATYYLSNDIVCFRFI